MTEVKVKTKKAKEPKYPDGVEGKMDDMSLEDLQVILKMVCLNTGQNQLLTACGFTPLQVQDAGNLVKRGR